MNFVSSHRQRWRHDSSNTPVECNCTKVDGVIREEVVAVFAGMYKLLRFSEFTNQVSNFLLFHVYFFQRLNNAS